MAEALVLAIPGKIGSILADEAVKSLVDIFKTKEKLRHISSEFKMMTTFLSQEEGDEHNNSSETWLKLLREVAHDVEDIIDEYAHLADVHHDRSCFEKILHTIRSVMSLHSIASRLKDIDVRLQELSDMRPRYNVSFEGESTSKISERQPPPFIPDYFRKLEEPIGIEPQKETLVKWLTNGNLDHPIVGVWGMAGVGKTTLVEKVFNSLVIKEHFDCCLWVSVSKKYEVDGILRKIMKDTFDGATVPEDTEKMNSSDLAKTVRRFLKGKRYLLVLDDVWSREDWLNLGGVFDKSCHGSKTVITTRTKEVAAFGGECVLELESLGEEDAWDLFCRRAFKNEDKRCPEALEKWAWKIVAKCQGLPLALVAIGSLLSDKPKDATEWKRFYDQFNRELSNNENANELNWVNKVINLSYNYLPRYLKRCFSYCSIFPEDYLFKRKRLIRLWVSEDFISVEGGGQQTPEELAEANLNELIQRSMLQVVERNSFGRVKACRMHDIVRESAVTISRKQDFHMVIDDLVNGNNIPQARRLLIHTYKDGVMSGVKLPSLWTFVVLGTHQLNCPNNIFLAVSTFKYLRVLDLQRFPISHLPDSVIDLFNLRHLDLRGTGISELPKLIGRLKKLQVMDLNDTAIKKLPPTVTKLKKLRYLNLPKDLEFQEDLCLLKDLQTLKFNARRQESVGWIGKLTQLRRLTIWGMKAAHCAELWASIAKLCFLSNLSIGLNHLGNDRFMFGDMDDVPLQHLQKLSLDGGMSDTEVPSLFRFFGNSLRELSLCNSELDEDPLLSLSHLSDLTSLKLYPKTYKGHQLCFKAGWFPHLKILNLGGLWQLSQLEIENGALQSLEKLHLWGMDALLVVPDGVKYLTSLKEIMFSFMGDEFMERIKGDDRSKVAHVPNIFSFGRNGMIVTRSHMFPTSSLTRTVEWLTGQPGNSRGAVVSR